MKIFFGSAGHLDLKLVDSPIAHKWYNLMFQNGPLAMNVITSQQKLIDIYQQKKQAYDTLVETVDYFNKIFNDKTINNLPHFRKFDLPSMTQQWYSSVHEQWAMTTLILNKLCYHAGQQRGKLDGLIKILVDNNYNQINEQVHCAEFFNDYISFEIQYATKAPDLFDGFDKAIVPADTDWHSGFISLSYKDVGRPQFEEWLIKRKVTGESSNYSYFDRKLNVRITNGCTITRPMPYQQEEYELFCEQHGLPVWKPYVNLIELADAVRTHLSDFVGDVFLPWIEESLAQCQFQLHITP